jgi:mRNA-degrading endonuclease YafQ of YafQ-DinJ toxin-antitoxin module
MNILTHPVFDKHFAKRIASNRKLTAQFQSRLELFIINPKHPTLRVHRLKGAKKDVSAFSVTGDIRVLYLEPKKNSIILLDIGSHNQVYEQ